MRVCYLPLSWTDYHDNALQLADCILSAKKPLDKIIAISRGGLTLGHLLTDFLKIPIATFTIQSYTDIQSHGESVITEPLKTNIRGKHVLLVDDVADSGKTLQRAIKYLARFHPASVFVSTMFFKPRSVFKPDYYVATTTNWILFPYEPTEMILLITKNMREQEKSEKEIHDFLKTLGYTEKQISFVRKYYPIIKSASSRSRHA